MQKRTFSWEHWKLTPISLAFVGWSFLVGHFGRPHWSATLVSHFASHSSPLVARKNPLFRLSVRKSSFETKSEMWAPIKDIIKHVFSWENHSLEFWKPRCFCQSSPKQFSSWIQYLAFSPFFLKCSSDLSRDDFSRVSANKQTGTRVPRHSVIVRKWW
jgi:hypothetical protein